MKKVIATDQAPNALGPYSQAIIATKSGMVYTAGQIGIDPDTSEIVQGGIKEQTRQVLVNIQAVLEASGSKLDYIVKTTVFLNNMNDFADMNEVYGTFFSENPPARSTVEVTKLPKDAKVEIEAVAFLT